MKLRDYSVAMANLQAAFAGPNPAVDAVNVLEDVFDDGVQHGAALALNTLCDTKKLAEMWGISLRQAQRHISRLEARGIGRRIGGVYVLTENEAKEHPANRQRGNPYLRAWASGASRKPLALTIYIGEEADLPPNFTGFRNSTSGDVWSPYLHGRCLGEYEKLSQARQRMDEAQAEEG